LDTGAPDATADVIDIALVGTKAEEPTWEHRAFSFPSWKRATDLVIASFALLFLLPLLMFVAAIIALDGGEVIFGHTRVGTSGKLFRVFKFRTMCADADQRLNTYLELNETARREWQLTQKLQNDPRVTWIGSFLRKSSIDELPQLLNVLRGEMSIVGPRPIVQSEIVRYGRYIQHYKRCRPGITGLWQVSGRNDVAYRRRVAFDTIYCRHMGDLRFELALLLRTVPAVLRSKGSY
jgi:lipopolysaccharide/colanic/teichoic acid biosynthesis glycosyltransferase